jgi:hypothetical protein
MLIFTASAISTTAQEFRGSISGTVTDSSGAAVPGAQITISNIATNTSATTTTNGEGAYTALYLTPGTYTVLVEANGFKKLLREGIEVRVGDKLTLDLALETGGVQETVTVTGEATLLQTASASTGQVIDRRRISELPLSDGNPFTLARLAAGATYTGELTFSRPFDNQGTSAIRAAGAPGRNEFTLDGTPNMASGGGQNGVGRVAFVPPADAVQEFKVETASFDAQQGHTAGANINVTLKTGTNSFHGTIYEFVRNDKLSANDWFANRLGRPRSSVRYNRYGATVGGPVILPGFGEGGPSTWIGRDRTFFFFAFEGLRDAFPEPDFFTVPTLAQRQGDFSALLARGITIYDPATAVQQGARVVRQPIQCNGRINVICPSRLSAISLNYLQFYPLPNLPGDALGRLNFFSAQTRTDTFHSESVRIDHTYNEKHRAFFRYTHNNRVEDRGNWSGTLNGINPTGNFLHRVNNGVTYDHVFTASPSTIINVRAGFNRFWEPNIRQHQGAFDPATLGFPPSTSIHFGDASYLPRFDFPDNTFSEIGNDVGVATSFNIYSFQPTVTKLTGNHSFRFGYDFRAYRENAYAASHPAGRYDFASNFTRERDNSTALFGQEFAAFLLGQPNAGFIDITAPRANQTLYSGLFVHDDWKVTPKLTLNLGLRFELEGATTERFNRNIRGFDPTTPNPIEPAARAAYAAAPIPQVPVASFRVPGGLLFTTEGERGFWESDKNNFQPRVGFAYQLDARTVLRGGWGIFVVPFVVDGIQQPGFSQQTNIIPTTNTGLTFVANLANPFPNGVAQPPGSSLGLQTFIGRNVEFVPIERSNGQAQRFSIGVQREMFGNWVFEGSYIGNRGYDLENTIQLNAIPLQYLSTSQSRDQATIDFLNNNVTNPFRNLAPGTNLNNATVQRHQLLRPFPQFTGVESRSYDGSSKYDSLQLRAEKRFSRGYSLLATYTWSKFTEKVANFREFGQDLIEVPALDDAPHRAVVSGIFELPFGKGRRWGKSWSGLVEGFLGGYQFQGIWQYQSGRPFNWGNVYYNGDPTQLRANIDGATVDGTFDTSGFYFHDAQVQTNGVDDPVKQRADQRIRLDRNVRYFPLRMSNFRGQPYHESHLSLIKRIYFTETMNLELRGELINAFNHPQFNNPNVDPTSSNFGKTTSMANLPRNIQLGIKFIF